ncbi:MAG: hypothetical protein QXH24_07175, partial [Candidatus Bathyarchaeia archaeon]
RLTPTGRGTLFRAKRWFYSTFYTKAPPEVKEENKRTWVSLAGKIIEELNKRDASNKPARLTISYEIGPRGEFKPISATIEVMEIKPVETFTIKIE